jgi:hypothetical protein
MSAIAPGGGGSRNPGHDVGEPERCVHKMLLDVRPTAFSALVRVGQDEECVKLGSASSEYPTAKRGTVYKAFLTTLGLMVLSTGELLLARSLDMSV